MGNGSTKHLSSNGVVNMSEPIRILILEDRPADAELMLHALRQAGISQDHQLVTVETDYLAALETSPDLILADWSLPQFSGMRALQLMNERGLDIPFIIVSGSIGEEAAVEALRLGAADYLLKDRLTRLGQAVRRALEDKKLREDRKRAEEQVRKLNAELELRVEERTRELVEAQEQLVRKERLAVLGQLAGGVSHELRNPLSVISSAIYYLKLVQPDAEEKIKQYHAMIEQETFNAEKIISDLLDFAHIESVDREPVSVPELVGRVLSRFPVPPSVEVRLDFPPDLPMVFADPRQIEQVIGNLTINACQAMPLLHSATVVVPQKSTGATPPAGIIPPARATSPKAGSTTGMPEGRMLAISARQVKEAVAISVKDTGTGISRENMKKIFEPLFTTKPKGIGLGLAVSKRLVEANDGRIEVESEPGNGSTFTIWLPIHSPDN
jgi:signal transduction histidine kinase